MPRPLSQRAALAVALVDLDAALFDPAPWLNGEHARALREALDAALADLDALVDGERPEASAVTLGLGMTTFYRLRRAANARRAVKGPV